MRGYARAPLLLLPQLRWLLFLLTPLEPCQKEGKVPSGALNVGPEPSSLDGVTETQ